ncbi:MAG: DUF5615 family PIN-like protein [Acidobacteria bacterium]|nr:DUF5615 family PIN-like protein [Acidobacteriota bacterium]
MGTTSDSYKYIVRSDGVRSGNPMVEGTRIGVHDGCGGRVKFLFDHDVPDDLSYLLEHLGHEVTLLRKAPPGNSPDDVVLQYAYLHLWNR